MSDKPDGYEWIFVLGFPIPRSEFYKLLLFGLSAVSVVVGLVVYFYWGLFFPEAARDAQVVKAEQVTATEVITAELKGELQVFFEDHFAATRYNEVESIRAVGTYSSGDVEMEFTLLAKNPHFYKQSLRYKDKLIEAGYDGSELWYHQSHAILDDSDEALMAFNRSLAMLECSIPALTWEYEKGEDSTVEFQLMPNEMWNQRECLVVRQIGLLDSPVYHYLDQETGLELYRRSSVKIDARRRKDVELIYAAPLEDAKYPIPAGFDLWVDGVLYCTAAFDQINVNAGLPNFLFKEHE
ncbi:MAG: hypothetical protein ACI8Z5_001085 [Lentimonas sp.]|jgi:hypothetical protein